MAELVREIQEEGRMGALISLLGLAFLYGLIHAAGPGHGKALATSFVLAKGPTMGRALVFGNTIALFHGLSGLALVLLLKTALVAFTGRSLDQVEYVAKIVSYSLIALIGLMMLVGALRKHRDPDTPDDGNRRTGSFWAMALSIGLVPCPGVVLVLLFSLSLDVLWIGALMALCQTAGMAVTISLVTVLVSTGRQGGLGLLRGKKKTMRILERALELGAGLGVLGLGLLFLAGTVF